LSPLVKYRVRLVCLLAFCLTASLTATPRPAAPWTPPAPARLVLGPPSGGSASTLAEASRLRPADGLGEISKAVFIPRWELRSQPPPARPFEPDSVAAEPSRSERASVPIRAPPFQL